MDILESHFTVGTLDFLVGGVPGDAKHLVCVPPELLCCILPLRLGSVSRHFQIKRLTSIPKKQKKKSPRNLYNKQLKPHNTRTFPTFLSVSNNFPGKFSVWERKLKSWRNLRKRRRRRRRERRTPWDLS